MGQDRIKLQYEDSHSKPPVFDWVGLESIPGPGKYLILNFSPVTKSLFISTAYIQEGMTAETLADYLKWAVAWTSFPNITYEIEPAEKELA